MLRWHRGLAGMVTLLSTPLFVAVPTVARRHSVAGPGISQLRESQTLLCVKLFSVASAVELSLFPCILLAAISFRPAERVVAAFVLLTPFIAYLGLDYRPSGTSSA